jgi:hypothetical protein
MGGYSYCFDMRSDIYGISYMGNDGMNLDELINVEFPVPQVNWVFDLDYEDE